MQILTSSAAAIKYLPKLQRIIDHVVRMYASMQEQYLLTLSTKKVFFENTKDTNFVEKEICRVERC